MNLRTLSMGIYAVESEGVVVPDGSASAFRVPSHVTFVQVVPFLIGPVPRLLEFLVSKRGE